ncbi:MAG: VOC family protein [Bacteroides helcogenes]|nr:VOC family protein [Bacteroides helcogenes]MDY5239536.1 VOC family protein [Bacteroides helcogenes]
MRIDHTAMYVHNLEAAKEFFIRFFSAQSNPMYHNPHTGLRSYFLTFADGSRLELMNRPEVTALTEKLAYQAGYIHLAFSVGGKEQVDALTKALAEAGYEVLSGPRTTGDGYYESCIAGVEGNLIEITE